MPRASTLLLAVTVCACGGEEAASNAPTDAADAPSPPDAAFEVDAPPPVVRCDAPRTTIDHDWAFVGPGTPTYLFTRAPDDAWSIEASSYLVRHWDGKGWADFPSPARPTCGTTDCNALSGIWERSTSDVYVLDYRKGVPSDMYATSASWHYDGSAWSSWGPALVNGPHFPKVVWTSPDEVWWAGLAGTSSADLNFSLAHGSGSSWTVTDGPALGNATPGVVFLVGETSADLFLGTDGNFFRRHGDVWDPIAAPTTTGSPSHVAWASSAGDATKSALEAASVTSDRIDDLNPQATPAIPTDARPALENCG